MSERGRRLSRTGDQQITELIDLLSSEGDEALGRPCPGREKLGDGTVAACAGHVADTYQRIAAFTTGRTDALHTIGPDHDGRYSAHNATLSGLLEQLTTARDAVTVLADLTDENLDAVPPAGAIRFADGGRTLEEVVASMLKHQGHQVRAVKAALA